MPTRESILRCGYLLPRILVLWLVVDLCLRFAPNDWHFVHHRDFVPELGSHQIGPFLKDQTYQEAYAYGDLAELGNCAECRAYRPLLVHMDSRGFPNPPASRYYDAVLVGDSFGVGVQQLPDSTLAAQLSAATGFSVYNASCFGHLLSSELLLRLIDELGLTHGTIFYELMDRGASIRSEVPGDDVFSRFENTWPSQRSYAFLQAIQQSPLANLSRQMVGRIYNGSLLPNPYAARVIRKSLSDGEPFLLYPEDMQNSAPDAPKFWAKYLRSLDRDLRQRNLDLVVILVPSKYTVYQPLLENAPETNKSRQFEELQAELADLTVVNTTPEMQKAAADALAHGKLLFWRDDTHWNADGVRVAARVVGQVLPAPANNSAVPTLRQVSRVPAR
jgi:hypothetical protein